MSKTVQRILFGLLAVLVIIQFFQIEKTNPETNPEEDFLYLAAPPTELGMLIKDACYDCHSHETEYPWYTYVQPVGWWIKGHIDEGREHFNLSIWATYDAEKRAHKLEEAIEEVEEGHMPLPSYTWIHSEADLTEAQREELTAWFEVEMKKVAVEEELQHRTEEAEVRQELQETEH